MRRFVCVLLIAFLATCVFAQNATPGATVAPLSSGDRIAALRAEIAHHDELYYRQAAPEISDFAYDELKRELAELERTFPEAAVAVPAALASTARDDRTGSFLTRVHGERMLSLEKTYAEADLRAWHAKLARDLGRADLHYVVEPKVDGIAISVTFEHGRLVHAVTRGNGVEGDDITANVLTIRGMPRELAARSPKGAANPIPERIELRGEVFLTFAEFERINRDRETAGEPLFANPRNAAAGSAKLTDPQQAAERRLSIVFYGWGACAPAALRPATQHDFAIQLRAWELPALEPGSVAHGIEGTWDVIERFGRTRAQLSFPTDGAVVKLDDVALRDVAGTSEDAPRWALAYKYAPDRAETQLLAITLQVGRSGVLTPVAEFAPVVISGSTVTRASLHNRAAIERRDLRIGDFVYVEKAGEIIPTVVGVNHARRPADSAPFVFPKSCPACSAAVASVDGEIAIRCPNAACPGQLRRRIEHFAASSCVEIEGLGPAMIAALVERGWVKTVADLYRLQRAELLTLGSDLATSTDSLLAAIQRSKRVELWRFIHGLSIPGVGGNTARDLARRFGDLNSLAHATTNDFASDVRSAADNAVLAYFAEPSNCAVVADLLALGIEPVPPVVGAANARVAGKVFVLTGKLPDLTRDEATAKIEAAGGVVNSSVSRQTDYVVAGEEPGAKLERAHTLGIRVIDEAELLRMLTDTPDP